MNVAEILKNVYPLADSATLLAIRKKLEEPFPPDVIQWKPQSISRDKTRAMAAAYADSRAYIDRLNAVVGSGNWFIDCEVLPIVVARDGKQSTKITVRVVLGIRGVGMHMDVGEEWADDDNAMTSAFAQAFKRAAMHFGLGRYLYDLPKKWYPINEYKQFVPPGPQLPSWALPKGSHPAPAAEEEDEPVQEAPAPPPQPRKPAVPEKPVRAGDSPIRSFACSSCGTVLKPYQVNGRTYTPAEVAKGTRQKYGAVLCPDCAKQKRVEAAAAN